MVPYSNSKTNLIRAIHPYVMSFSLHGIEKDIRQDGWLFANLFINIVPD